MSVTVEELEWSDPPLAELDLPGGRLSMVWGFGSGLTRRAGDSEGQVWAVGDRGPNLHVAVAIERYGVEAVAAHVSAEGAKVMPLPAIGPALAELQVGDGRVDLVQHFPITVAGGRAISGLPPPGSAHARLEPAIAMDGTLLGPDPAGADSEGLVAFADGGFVVGDEYGPSLLRLDADGRVLARWVPEGHEAGFAGAGYPVEARLPAIAARRRLNRGFEALAATVDGGLLLAFQSPLADPDSAASKAADHVRLWKLDADGRLAREYLYRLEPVTAFRRDPEAEPGDRKVSELTALGGDAFLVLERVSASTKFFRVELGGGTDKPGDDVERRSAAGEPLAGLAKTLVLDTDEHPEIGADLEGATLLSPGELLICNDNDFGVEGARTRFWRVRFDPPLTADPRKP